jgi:hypothetical protein
LLGKAQARRRTRQQARQRCFAHCQRVAPHVFPVELDQVEAVQEDASVVAPIANTVEVGDPVVIACNRFTIDNAGA